MKIVTLVLSFIFALTVSVGQIEIAADEVFSFDNIPNKKENAKEFGEENGNGTTAAKVIVYNAMVKRLKDDNSDGYYSKVQWYADIDAEKTTNVFVRVYARHNNDFNYTTGAGMESPVFTLEGGYEPTEGITFSTLFYSGRNKQTRNTRIEVYYENGDLACTFGPDDDPDFKDNPVQSLEYDEKENPFTSPTPTSTPDDEGEPKIKAHVVDASTGDSIAGAKATLRKDDDVVDTASSDGDGNFELTNLEYGRYDLLVYKKGYRKKFLVVNIYQYDTGTEKVTIKLKKR